MSAKRLRQYSRAAAAEQPSSNNHFSNFHFWTNSKYKVVEYIYVLQQSVDDATATATAAFRITPTSFCVLNIRTKQLRFTHFQISISVLK